MAAAVAGSSRSYLSALSWRPYFGWVAYTPSTMSVSPTAMPANSPTTVTSSPSAESSSTVKPVCSLWKMTVSTPPSSR